MKITKSGQKTQKIDIAQLKNDVMKIAGESLQFHGLLKKTKKKHWES